MNNDETIYQIRTEALWEQEREREELHNQIRDAVRAGSGTYVTAVVSMPSGGHVVGVQGMLPATGDTFWTTVYGGVSDHSYYRSPELAMLALISRQQDDDPNVTRQAVKYAARVLGVPEPTP